MEPIQEAKPACDSGEVPAGTGGQPCAAPWNTSHLYPEGVSAVPSCHQLGAPAPLSQGKGAFHTAAAALGHAPAMPPPASLAPLPPRPQALPRKPSLATALSDDLSALPLLPAAAGTLGRLPSAGAPVTPSTLNPQAAATPPPADADPAAASSAAGAAACSSPAAAAGAGPQPSAAAAAAAAAADAAARAAVAVALWRRIQSFMRVALGSSLVMSALMALEVEGSHPASEGAGGHGLRWTLAQMLAMHLKAGYPTASETELLAILWTLESWGNVWRSPCTAALQSYLRHLTAFDHKRALGMSTDWANQFCSLRRAMSESQLGLLKKLDWRVRLDFAKEVAPCWDLLFKLPQAPPTPTRAAPAPSASPAPAPPTAAQQPLLHGGAPCALPPSPFSSSTPAPAPALPAASLGPAPGAPAGPPAASGASGSAPGMRSVREAWVLRMDALCADICHRARAAAEAEAAASQAVREAAAAAAEEEEEDPCTPAPRKRQRCE